ncbi:MEDS domain-containing protein [Paenisporosarcina quisquiliarum]|uniref:MEDS domain-containing protein n=1 Tax=Paenisporosarcina quisquiliarum TaxID=365346 RepID=A0A9X3LG29_9BACL|nr:MEDS domain-containing protein [Paenisporosarcina quisquiliarum]MCZ8537087.1 MEDS domain-containing protein [Paenisporosarcina quisquiliarum]
MDALYKSELEKITVGHVFYEFQEEEAYLNNLISFIRSGIEGKQHILIIENMRNLPKVRTVINMLFSEEQQSSIRLVNNFEYYLSNGDFNTQSILNHFQQDLEQLTETNTTIRTWAHVEWASSEPDVELLKEFESTADAFVTERRLLSVCAYSSTHLSPNLASVLELRHEYIMNDETLSLSPLYER